VAQSSAQNSFTSLKFLLVVLLGFLMLLPLVLSNGPVGATLGILSLILLFFFPGYLLLSLVSKLPDGLRLLLSFVFGIASIATAFDISCRASMTGYFYVLVAVLSTAGIILIALRSKGWRAAAFTGSNGYETMLAGCAVSLGIAPFLWRSGRTSGSEFVFYGPAGKDPLFHVTLLQRLLLHTPPDNFIVSGLRAPVYHYFDDLTLALVLRTQQAWHLTATNLFDLYFRSYPALLYLLLGALAYRVGKQLAGTRSGGVLGALLLLGGGGLGWFLGALQTVSHAAHLAALRASLFSTWTAWDGVDSIMPLVHRPAHYHGLLLSLAAITILLQPSVSRRDWAVAGLLLGLMSGFNFTLAATFGGMAVFGAVVFALRRKQSEAAELFWLALFLFIGSLPVLSAMLLSGFHNNAAGFPFRGPNLEFPATLWGSELAHIVPIKLVPWAALIVLPIFAYGVKLLGLPAMGRLDLGGDRRRSLAMVLALVFSSSVIIGLFFPYNAFGGAAIIFIQPTIWILALFSIRPIDAWFTRNRGGWPTVALWCVLGLIWLQALASFNFSQRVAFDQETARAFQDIRAVASHEDVIAYLPSDVIERAILGRKSESTNFTVMAMTGLDGYFSSQGYSTFFAVPGLSGTSANEILAHAEHIYQQRLADVNSFLRGEITQDARARLESDHVRWIVVSDEALHNVSPSLLPWRITPEISIYRLQ